jgi:hypothetical protein
MNGDTEKAIEEILNDFERQPLQDRRTFRAYLNQPELICLSSTNAQTQSPPISPMTFNQYYNFTVNLPRPALDVKSLQLLKAVIPQAQCSIPDYSLVFPYYRLRTVPIDDIGQVAFVDLPTLRSICYVRLLPSYYKPELLSPSYLTTQYGFNRTFNDYEELVNEINKGCKFNLQFTAPENYIANDVEFYYDKQLNKIIFRGLNAYTPPEINAYELWSPDNTYATNVIIFYDLEFYKSKIDDNIGNLPPVNSDKWERIRINGYTTWSSTQVYNVNNVVQYNDIFYRATAFSTGADDPPPVDTARWQDVSQYFEGASFNTYLIGGYNDPIVKQLLQYVEFESTEQDFFTIASIPGNQYVEGQTLARRMGFTWDKTGMIYDFSINNYLTSGVDFGGTGALFYNRFRVIPTYLPSEASPPPLLTSSVTGSSDSYTADGYCCLVYSSIVNVYTTIVGTSSVDTQRNANLLAMIEMNCANLGVAMIGNYIDTSLTKIQSDIYSIYIELRDENGEPYYLTNNAVTNFLLKLTY